MKLLNALKYYPENPILFYTATVLNWQHLLKPDAYKQKIIDSLAYLVAKKKVWVYGFVVMPNHIHILWRVQDDYVWKDIKRDFNKYTAQVIKLDLMQTNATELENYLVDVSDRKYQIWERNALAVPCLDRDIALQKLNYIHKNPIQERWQLADVEEGYYFSSAKWYMNRSGGFDFLTDMYEHL